MATKSPLANAGCVKLPVYMSCSCNTQTCSAQGLAYKGVQLIRHPILQVAILHYGHRALALCLASEDEV